MAGDAGDDAWLLAGNVNHRWRARLEAVELGAMAPASAFHEFLAVVAEHDDDGVVEQLLLAQMVDHAADLRIDVVRGVDVAVLDLADLRLEIGGDVVEIFEIGLGDRRLGREVVVGVRRLEEHVGHERALCIAPVDEVEHFADVDLIALPRIGAALALMHVRWIHLREDRLVEGREGEALAGVKAELVVLLLHHVHHQRRTAVVEHREPVGAVQPVEHREDAHLRQVAAAVVFLQPHRLFRELPGLRHDLRVEHVKAQRFGD